MSKHSAIVGGSTAGRLVNCPASLARTRALPPSADAPSEYAEEGSAMHEIMATLMTARCADELHPGGRSSASEDAFALLGSTVHGTDRVLTQDHLDSMILPALEHLDTLEAMHDGHFRVVGVERRVVFPGVPGAFGTVDLMLQSDTHVLLVDWKFGQGVGVRTVYSDGEGAIVNPQLLYYAAAALKTKPTLFRAAKLNGRTPRKIVVAIIQPRGIEPLTFTEVTRHELRQFVEDVHDAVLAAVDRSPPIRKGEWCRFAPCKIDCPLWVGPLLDLSALQPRPREIPTRRDVTPYGEYLAHAKALVDQAVMLKTELDSQMHAYLEAGGAIPGWRLKDKATRRQWADRGMVADTLIDLGFTEDEIWREPELLTFQTADAIAKRRGVKIPDELRVAPPPSGTTLATIDDPAPIVEPTALIEKFSAALRQLQQAQKEPLA